MQSAENQKNHAVLAAARSGLIPPFNLARPTLYNVQQSQVSGPAFYRPKIEQLPKDIIMT